MNKLNLDIVNQIFSFVYEFPSHDYCKCYQLKKTSYHQISNYYNKSLPRKKIYKIPAS